MGTAAPWAWSCPTSGRTSPWAPQAPCAPAAPSGRGRRASWCSAGTPCGTWSWNPPSSSTAAGTAPPLCCSTAPAALWSTAWCAPALTAWSPASWRSPAGVRSSPTRSTPASTCSLTGRWRPSRSRGPGTSPGTTSPCCWNGVSGWAAASPGATGRTSGTPPPIWRPSGTPWRAACGWSSPRLSSGPGSGAPPPCPRGFG